ncbi:hypothetical protein FHR71_003711 [Methylobacterium sp. RAS18]|nr:hypothetical protein [Methylobacterium sp. RAS18]
MRASSLVVAAALAAIPAAAEAQASTSVARAPTLTIERYREDWSYRADPARRTGGWTERFKDIPLSEDGSIYLSTGVEIRTRYESYANLDWRSARNASLAWQRVVLDADLRRWTETWGTPSLQKVPVPGPLGRPTMWDVPSPRSDRSSDLGNEPSFTGRPAV